MPVSLRSSGGPWQARPERADATDATVAARQTAGVSAYARSTGSGALEIARK